MEEKSRGTIFLQHVVRVCVCVCVCVCVYYYLNDQGQGCGQVVIVSQDIG